MPLNPAEGVALYTDGSAWNGDRSGGWAFIAVDAFDNDEEDYGAAQDTTNNRMEMQALISGLGYLHDNYGSVDVLVFSDSMYVIAGASIPGRARNVNLEYWHAIDAGMQLHSHVEFVH